MRILTLNKKNIFDFSFERNNLLSKVKDNEWVFFLDQDEKLFKPLTSFDNNYDCYYIKRKNFFLSKYVGTDKIIRFVKKDTGEWKRAVHEKWIPKSKSKIGFIKSNYIIHNTSESLKEYLTKINLYSTLHARENKKENKKPSIFKIVFYPVLKFFITLVKSKNIVFSIMQSLHSFLSWTKLYLRQY